MPRVILVPGIGLFGVGATAKDASIAADVAETTISVIANAERGGRFESISEREQFEIEYWSLEQAKLAGRKALPLQGQVVVITGGAGTIGLATAAAFRARGAEVVLLDLDASRTKLAAKPLNALGIGCNVTDRRSVAAAFDAVVAAYGGVDIVVSNAGGAWQGRIGDVDDATLRRSFELNFFAHQNVAQAAVKIMRRQGTGGALLFNVSKQAINPGPDFGPYGLPKAATLSLMRQYAVDYGGDGITSNAVNADRIRSGLTDALIKKRAKARRVTEHDYLAGNLLGRGPGRRRRRSVRQSRTRPQDDGCVDRRRAEKPPPRAIQTANPRSFHCRDPPILVPTVRRLRMQRAEVGSRVSGQTENVRCYVLARSSSWRRCRRQAGSMLLQPSTCARRPAPAARSSLSASLVDAQRRRRLRDRRRTRAVLRSSADMSGRCRNSGGSGCTPGLSPGAGGRP
jgi:NAD(P)-dependent dehydrogenase (short-subunit alcohol dehydrogenase family)